LATVCPDVAGALPQLRMEPPDSRWRTIAARHGYSDPEAYLASQHIEQHRSVAAIALELGVSRDAGVRALARQGIPLQPHATKRHLARLRAEASAEPLGFADLTAYVADRRGRGMTWRDMAQEVGVPETSLRRQGCLPC